MKLKRFEAKEWAIMAANAHLACFGEHRDPDLNRIDYALLVVTDDDQPAGYLTIREMDAEMVYMSYGGAFPTIKDSFSSYRVYQMFHEYIGERYRLANTLVLNSNSVMIKFALKAGMVIIGTKTVNGDTFVELLKEYKK